MFFAFDFVSEREIKSGTSCSTYDLIDAQLRRKPQPTVGLKLRNNLGKFLVRAEHFWLGKKKENELLGKRELMFKMVGKKEADKKEAETF